MPNTPHNEVTIDEILNELMEYSHSYGKGEIPSSENPPLIIARQAKLALTTLIDGIVERVIGEDSDVHDLNIQTREYKEYLMSKNDLRTTQRQRYAALKKERGVE